MIRFGRKTLFTLIVLVLFGTARSENPLDYQADFIAKLLSYIEWPAGSSAGSGVVIAVIGDSPLTGKLKSATSGQSVEIRQLGVDDPLDDIHIIYMVTQDKADLAKILKKAEPRKILTISDAPSFAKFGVMINFYREAVDGQEKTKFEVNKMAINAAGIKISSQLLKLAKLI